MRSASPIYCTLRRLSLCVSLAMCMGFTYSQSTKGLSLTASTESKPTGKTYALIIGISKYKNPAIPALEYADRDAVAFRNYLVTTGVDSNNVTLLTNEQAVYSEILLNIHELTTEKAKKGDRVYIYFSGHGDVESKVMTQDGYLLPYDAPKVVYAISAINVRILQEYVSTMSTHGVEVVLISDACHAGTLAGGIEGIQNISAILKENWRDEIKMLSCQPGELSLENKQWGNGRGLFSFELIKGMAGMADRNKDGNVTLLELNLYLADRVSEQAKPLHQNPMTSGNMNAVVSYTNSALLASLSAPLPPIYTALSLKGYEEVLISTLDDSLKGIYHLYQQALNHKRLGWADRDSSAYGYYQRMPHSEATKVILALMKRNLAAALINHLTEQIGANILNQSFAAEAYMVDIDEHRHMIRALLDSIEIIQLGLLPKLLYEEACNERDILTYPTIRSLDLLDQAVLADPNASYAFGLLAHLLHLAHDYKSSAQMALRAIHLSPGFLYPYRDLAYDYLYLDRPDSALYYACMMNTFDTISFISVYDVQTNKMKPGPNKHLDENMLMGLSYYLLGKKDSVNLYFRRCYGDDYIVEPLSIAKLLFYTGKFQEALRAYQKQIIYFSDTISEHAQDRYELKGDPLGITSSSGNYSTLSNIYLKIACCQLALHHRDDGFTALDQSLACAFRSYSGILEHPQIHYYSDILIDVFSSVNHIALNKSNKYLDPIRDDPQFKTLMRKYFPDQYKEK